MHWRYLKWDDSLAAAVAAFEDLLSLFNFLLLQASGDVDRVLQWMRYLQERGMIDADVDLEEFRDRLEDENLIERDGEGGYSLTARGEQRIRKESLALVFRNLAKGGFGQHRVPHTGEGGERTTETRGYRAGDPITQIDALGTISNAVKRGGLDDITLQEQDFEVYESEHQSSCATVLLIDISHSMILYGEDRITPAKQVALALSELIMTQYPRDSLHVAYFGDDAKLIDVGSIPYLRVGPYHTNTKAGLQLAQSVLRAERHANKQVFMITDGKPSAIFEDGRIYKNSFGLDPKIVNQTLDEAAECKRYGIVITTFMVTEDPYLVEFVEELSQINRGRAYYAAPANWANISSPTTYGTGAAACGDRSTHRRTRWEFDQHRRNGRAISRAAAARCRSAAASSSRSRSAHGSRKARAATLRSCWRPRTPAVTPWRCRTAWPRPATPRPASAPPRTSPWR